MPSTGAEFTTIRVDFNSFTNYQIMQSRKLEWFGHVKRRDETENIRAVVEMKMEGKRPRGRPKLRWEDTVRSY